MRRILNFLGLAAIILSITLMSCEKDDNNGLNTKCNVSNPTEEIAWLKQAIDDSKKDEYAYYVMAAYNGETVFYHGNCNPLVNYDSIVRNCNGDNLGYTNDLYNDLSDITILWKHEDSKCNFQE